VSDPLHRREVEAVLGKTLIQDLDSSVRVTLAWLPLPFIDAVRLGILRGHL
jgi:hypothetical protein